MLRSLLFVLKHQTLKGLSFVVHSEPRNELPGTCIVRLSQAFQPQDGTLWEGGQAADDAMRGGYCSGSVRQRWCERSLVCVEGEVSRSLALDTCCIEK